MSSIPNVTSASALPVVNIHAHGHKKGSHVGSSSDSTGGTSAQIPVGSAQGLFGSLLQSLEQAVGVQPSTATPPVAASATAALAASGVRVHA